MLNLSPESLLVCFKLITHLRMRAENIRAINNNDELFFRFSRAKHASEKVTSNVFFAKCHKKQRKIPVKCV